MADVLVYENVSEERNPLAKVSEIVRNKLENLKGKGVISEKNFNYLRGKNNKLGRFYSLPKIHKRLVDVPGRPVISNCGTPTEGLSELVDHYLQPIVKSLPNVIRDTTTSSPGPLRKDAKGS